jgi:hypothetical protein
MKRVASELVEQAQQAGQQVVEAATDLANKVTP